MKQQFDTLAASKESLLTAYNQEQAMVTSLQQQLQRMREESAMIKEESTKIKEESAAMKKANVVSITNAIKNNLMLFPDTNGEGESI